MNPLMQKLQAFLGPNARMIRSLAAQRGEVGRAAEGDQLADGEGRRDDQRLRNHGDLPRPLPRR